MSSMKVSGDAASTTPRPQTSSDSDWKLPPASHIHQQS